MTKTKAGPIHADRLKSFADRIDRLEDERKELGGDIKDVYSEVKSAGYNVKALRRVLAERRKKTDAELEADIELYRAQLSEPGASLRTVAAQNGISKSKLQRLVPKNANGTGSQNATPRACVDDGSALAVADSLSVVPRPTTSQPAPDGGVGSRNLIDRAAREHRAPSGTTLKERLDYYVSPEPNSGCWLWRGTIRDGYGVLKWNGHREAAHRLSYAVHRGPIPDGLDVCHKCDVPSCINPDHLWLGTNHDNSADRDAKGRTPKGSAHAGSKLTDGQAAAILRATGSARSIAEVYGVHHSTVQDIKQGVAWAHLRKDDASTTIFAESANNESCGGGEVADPLGGGEPLGGGLAQATPPPVGRGYTATADVAPGPHDTDGEVGGGSTRLCEGTAQASRPGGPVAEATADRSRSPLPAISDAQALANLEEVEAAFFLRRDSTRVVA